MKRSSYDQFRPAPGRTKVRCFYHSNLFFSSSQGVEGCFYLKNESFDLRLFKKSKKTRSVKK